MDRQQWLSALNMLPISESIFVKKFQNIDTGSNINWILFDVYKIAADFPLEVSIYGYIFNETIINSTNNEHSTQQRLQITDKFLSKSTRDDLKGLQLKCGLAVCIHTQDAPQSTRDIVTITYLIIVHCTHTDCISGKIHVS